MIPSVEIAARVFRGQSVEAVHYASIAVIDKNGRLTHYLGDPDLVTMTRSSIKPFQLMPFIVGGAADHFGYAPEQLAIMCGSHVGSDRHREVVMSNLALAGNAPEHLQCGCHWPIWMQMENIYPRHGEDKDPVRHNCSGKHSGFLAQARFLGEDQSQYLNPQSKTQQFVKETLARYCEYEPHKMFMGVDGCSAPNYPLPVRNLALGFKKLANSEGDDRHREAARRIKEAVTAFPLMVSGEKRFDYDLKRSFPGNVVCKIGAESVEGIGFSDPAIGIAVKIHDGNTRALGPICVEVLKQLGIIRNISDYQHLSPHESPELLNNRDLVTGHIVAEFKLKKV